MVMLLSVVLVQNAENNMQNTKLPKFALAAFAPG
jgi:hypothetical protein